MNIRSMICLVAALFATGVASAKKEIVRIPAPEGILPVVVTEMTVGNTGNAYGDYERLAYALERVAKERKWPVKIAAEKIAANVPDYQTELRISLQRLRQEIPGEYLYRAWTNVTINGKDHDLGIVSYGYRYRMGENMDDVLDKSFLGGARATAEKIEPLLFPELKNHKK